MLNKIQLKNALASTPKRFAYDEFLKFGGLVHLNDIKEVLGDNDTVREYLLMIIRLGVSSRSKIFDAINGDNQDPVIKANNLNFANVFYNVAMSHAGVMVGGDIKTINDKLMASAREGWKTNLPVSFGVDRLSGVLNNLEIVSGGDKSPLFDEYGNIIPTRENFKDEVKRPYLEEWFGVINIDPEEMFDSYEALREDVKKMFSEEELHEEISSIPTSNNVNTDPYRYSDELEKQMGLITKALDDGLMLPAVTGAGKTPIQYEILESNVQDSPIKMIGKVTYNYAIESIVIASHDVGGVYGVIIDENTDFEFEVRDNFIVSFRENTNDDFKPLLEYHKVYDELVLKLEDEVPQDPINFSMIKNKDMIEEATLEWYLWNFNVMIENAKKIPNTLENIYHLYANSFFRVQDQYINKEGVLDPSSDKYIEVLGEYKEVVEELKNDIIGEGKTPNPITLTPIHITGLGDHLEDLERFFSTEPKHYEAKVTNKLIIGSVQTVVDEAFLQPIHNKKINGYVLDKDTGAIFIVVNGIIVWYENEDRNILPLLSWGDNIHDFEHRRILPYGETPITKFSEELLKDVVPEWLMLNYQLVNKELSFDIEMDESLSDKTYIVNTSSFEPLVKVDKDKILELNKTLNTLQVALDNNMLDNDSLKELGIEAPSDLTPMKGEESLEKEPTPPIIEEEADTPEVKVIESKEDEMSTEELNKIIEKSEVQMLEDVEAVENGNVTIGKIALMLITNTRTMNVVLSEIADIKSEAISIRNHIKDNNRGLASALELLQGIDENFVAPVMKDTKGKNALSINLNAIDKKLDALVNKVNTVGLTSNKPSNTKITHDEAPSCDKPDIEKFDMKDESVEDSIEFQHPIVNGDDYELCFGEIMEDTFSKSLNDNLGDEDVCQDGYIEGSDEAVICKEDGRIVVSRLFNNKGESVTGRVKDSVTGKLFDFKNGYIMKVECPYEGKRGMIPIINAKDYYEYSGNDSMMTTFDIAKGESITGTFTRWLYELSTEGNDVTKGFANGMYQDLFYAKEKPKLTVVGEDKKTVPVDEVLDTTKEVETPKEEVIPSKIKFYDGTQLIGLATDNSGDFLLSSQIPGEEAVYMIPSMSLNGQIFTPSAVANMLGVTSRELLPIFGKEYEEECANWSGGVITSREAMSNFDLMIPWAEVKASLGLVKQAQIKQDVHVQQTAQVVNTFANNVVANTEYYREIGLENTQAYSIPLSVTNDVVAFDDHDVQSLVRHMLENKATNLQTYNAIVGYLVITASLCTTNSSLMTDKTSPEYRAMISYAHAVGDVLRSLGEGNEEITRLATMYTIMYPNTGSLIITE